MPPRPAVEVSGASQLRSALRRAGDDLSDLKDANAQAAATVASAARPAAPRRTGRLAASVRFSGTKTQAIVRAGGARLPYAGAIHWGWPARHITADPFISDAAVRTQPTWLGIYQARIVAIIERITQ